MMNNIVFLNATTLETTDNATYTLPAGSMKVEFSIENWPNPIAISKSELTFNSMLTFTSNITSFTADYNSTYPNGTDSDAKGRQQFRAKTKKSTTIVGILQGAQEKNPDTQAKKPLAVNNTVQYNDEYNSSKTDNVIFIDMQVNNFNPSNNLYYDPAFYVALNTQTVPPVTSHSVTSSFVTSSPQNSTSFARTPPTIITNHNARNYGIILGILLPIIIILLILVALIIMRLRKEQQRIERESIVPIESTKF